MVHKRFQLGELPMSVVPPKSWTLFGRFLVQTRGPEHAPHTALLANTRSPVAGRIPYRIG
jgi:hypothetical protein